MKIKIMKYFNKLIFIKFLCKYKIYFRKIYFYIKSKRNLNLTDIKKIKIFIVYICYKNLIYFIYIIIYIFFININHFIII